MSQEARRNLIALLIAALILLLFAAFAVRPAVLLPVTDGAITDSVNSATGAAQGKCLERQDGFSCVARIPGDSDPGENHRFRVDTDWDGCWRAMEVAAERTPIRESGCIHLWNY